VTITISPFHLITTLLASRGPHNVSLLPGS